MIIVTGNPNTWTAAITTSTVDTILYAQTPVKICFGAVVGNVGVDVDQGYQVIVPAGVDVSIKGVSGQAASVVTGPFGVAA